MEVPVKTRSGETFYVQVDEDTRPGAVEGTGLLPEVRATNRGRGRIDTELSKRPGAIEDANLLPEGQGMGRGEAVLDTALFSKAVDVIKGISEEVTAGLMSTDPRPSEVELSLSLGFDAAGNVWIFKGGANANLRLMLKWKLP